MVHNPLLLNDAAGKVLWEVISQYGKDLVDEFPRCQGLLFDGCHGKHEREVGLLRSAHEKRVPNDLLEPPDGFSNSDLSTDDNLLKLLARRLEDELSCTSYAARWAVDSWAMALGLIAPANVVKPPPPPVVRRSTPARTNSIGMALVQIPAESYWMGAADKLRNEEPVHEVEISAPMSMGVHLVTQQQYQRVMGKNPSWFSPHGDHARAVEDLDTDTFPVEGVSWFDAVDFCCKLSSIENLTPCYRFEQIEHAKDGSIKNAVVTECPGTGYRLPTEAEWEFACRAGSGQDFFFGDDDAALEEYGWFDRNAQQRPHPVGEKAANNFGLADTHGNMWEWCQDWFGGDYYTKSPKVDPRGPDTGFSRVCRGGCWEFGRDCCRSAFRYHFGPECRFDVIGFRVALAES